ncbi:MAG: hypothetical protein AB4372_09170 [Xenococcus sp. (in: cyanobacteria)]
MRIPIQSAPSLRKNRFTFRKNISVGLTPQQFFTLFEAEEEEEAARRVRPGGGRIAKYLWCRFGPQGGSRDDCAAQANS